MLMKYSREKNEVTYRTGEGGEKRLLSNPGLGGSARAHIIARVIHGVN